MSNPNEIFEKLTAIINSDMDFYSHLLKMNNNINLVSKIIQALKSSIKRSFSEQIAIDEKTLNLVVDYAVAGMITVYQSWFISDKSQSVEEISKTISIMTFSGINGLLDRTR